MEKSERIKILRILNEFTQDGLAMACGIKQASIASYERGAYGVPEVSIKKIAKHLMVDPAYLQYGYPSLSGRVWQPSIVGKGLVRDLKNLFSKLMEENGFTESVTRKYVEGTATLIMAHDRRASLYISRSAMTRFSNISLYDGFSEGLVSLNNFSNFMSKNIVIAGETKFMADLMIADFGIGGLSEDDFEWPVDVLKEMPSYEKIIEFILSESLEYLLMKTVDAAAHVNIPHLFCELVAPQIQKNLLKLATGMIEKKRTDAAVAMKNAIDLAINDALKVYEGGATDIIQVLNSRLHDENDER